MVLNTFRQKNRAAPRQQSDSIGSNDIRIGEDFPDRVRKQRSLLYPFMKEALDSGKKASLRYDKLYVDGKIFRFDESKNQPVSVNDRD